MPYFERGGEIPSGPLPLSDLVRMEEKGLDLNRLLFARFLYRTGRMNEKRGREPVFFTSEPIQPLIAAVVAKTLALVSPDELAHYRKVFAKHRVLRRKGYDPYSDGPEESPEPIDKTVTRMEALLEKSWEAPFSHRWKFGKILYLTGRISEKIKPKREAA